MCGLKLDEHDESRADDAPVPRVPCLRLKRYFVRVQRVEANPAPPQTDAEIGAMVRAAYAAHNSQPGSLVDLDRIESVVVSGVFGPGKLELTVRHSSKLKPGVER
jgi:hypothetical protein